MSKVVAWLGGKDSWRGWCREVELRKNRVRSGFSGEMLEWEICSVFSMYHGSKLLPKDSPSISETNEPKNVPNSYQQVCLAEVEGYRDGSRGRKVWKRKEVEHPVSRGSTPIARVGVQSPPTPAARLIDSTKVQNFTNTPQQHPNIRYGQPGRRGD